MTQEQAYKILEKEGYSDFHFVQLKPGEDPGPHTHERDTLQIILAGELIIEDEQGIRSYIYEDRLKSPAGTSHTGMVGPEGASFVAGFK